MGEFGVLPLVAKVTNPTDGYHWLPTAADGYRR